jgi:NADH:ubiquinone oxidoreductase subunit H
MCLQIWMIVTVLAMVLLLLQRVAFVTLYERHLLGLTQGRLGPNKLTLSGCVQPIVDGVKLLKKEQVSLFGVNKVVYFLAPTLAFVLLGCEWLVVPYKGTVVIINYGFLYFLVIIGCSVYPIMISGINSKSKYGVLGAIRASAQTVSFEVVYTLLMLRLMVFMNSYEVSNYRNLFVLS